MLTVCSATSGFFSGRAVSRLGMEPVVMINSLITALTLLGFSRAPAWRAVVVRHGAGAVDAGMWAASILVSNRHMARFGVGQAVVGTTLFALPGLPSTLSFMGLLLTSAGCVPIYPSLLPAACSVLASLMGLGVIMPVIIGQLLVLTLVTMRLNRLIQISLGRQNRQWVSNREHLKNSQGR